MPTLAPPSPLRANIADEWSLAPGVAFLNHGSFGATPRKVLEIQRNWRDRIEAEPVQMIGRRSAELILESRRAAAAFVGAKVEDLALVTNATEGVNAVLRSLEFAPGDELLTTRHVYNAVRQSMKFVAERWGATYREIPIPLPIVSSDAIADTVISAIGPRTKLLVIDHVTSPTALIFPVERIVAECNRRGVDVIVDGAHAPGMLQLALDQLGAAYYAGNFHKWVCAPKGCAFLHVRKDRQTAIHPTVISHHLGEGFEKEFNWQGTRDFSAWFTLPSAIDFLANLGQNAIRAHNRALVLWAQQMLCEEWNVAPLTPSDGSLLGNMATLAVPSGIDALPADEWKPLQHRLYDQHKIEVPCLEWEGRRFIRICAQVYNKPDDYQRLADAIDRETQPR